MLRSLPVSCSPSSSAICSRSFRVIDRPILSMLALCTNALGLAGSDPLLRRLRLLIERMLARSEMTWPAPGAAVTIVPGVAAGGGMGESVLKSGWICDSFDSVGEIFLERRGSRIDVEGL